MGTLVLIGHAGLMLTGFILIGLGIRDLRNRRNGSGWYIFWGFVLVANSMPALPLPK